MVQSIKTLVLSTVLTIVLSTSASAQQEHHPKITIGHAGIGTLKEDLTYLLSLTTPAEQKQLVNLIDFIDLLMFGVDPDRPIRVDILSGTSPPTYVIWGPYQVLANLRDDNLSAQFQMRRDSKDLHRLLGQDPGWFRVLPRLKYGILILAQNEGDMNLLKQIILKLVDPAPEITPLLINSANLGMSIVNDAIGADDMDKRRNSFGEFRSNKQDALQKRPTESATEFALRKALVANQIDELERLLVEAKEASMKTFLDRKTGSARIMFSAEAIAETSLAGSIALFGQKPDAFDSVKPLADTVLSLRGNHPIDELRQKHALTFIDLMQKDAAARIAADSKLTPDQKTASQGVFDGIMEVAADGIKSGNVNGFLESIVNGDGEFVSIAAVSVVGGKRLDAALEMIAGTGNGNKISMKTSKVGDVDIHELQLAEGFFPLFDDLFGAGKTLYVGTTDSIVWIGTGEESLPLLTAAIEGLGAPQNNDTVLTIKGRVLPWAERTLKLVKDLKLTDQAQEQKRRDRQRSLELAVSSLQEKDDASFTMKVADGVSTGEIFVNTGILKYLGREISLYSKNNLQ
ncbi:MAG: hypothetical protein NXI04_09605 [Planctomycetaceae bacterium]|nr:hypothetical protein [Planctomycetaceae bacterium]